MARSKYLFVASMDVDPSKEALFNEVYDTEHCPELSQVSGVGRSPGMRLIRSRCSLAAKPEPCPLTDAPASTPSTRSSRRRS